MSAGLSINNHDNAIDLERQVSRGGGDVLQPLLPNKNVTFSVMVVEGVEWVCEQLSETQCKPLYPKVRHEIKKKEDSGFKIFFVFSNSRITKTGGSHHPSHG